MSNSSAARSQAAIVIKGSWEDLLAQAHRAAANQSDEAIGLYEKVRNGLQRLPEKVRAANGGRLKELEEEAAANLHVYLTQRDRYDDALAALTHLEQVEEPDRRLGWQHRRAMVLALAGRKDESLAQLRRLAESPDGRLIDWGNLAMQYARFQQYEEAEAVIDEAAAWVEQARLAGTHTGANAKEESAYLANLRSIVAIAAGRFEEGVTHFEEAAALDPYYHEHPYLLYVRLMLHNQVGLALPWIQRDKTHPIRSGLWHGIALKRTGKDEEAHKRWQQTAKLINERTSDEEFVEAVLLYFYLGDQAWVGLNAVLRVLQSGGAQSAVPLFLAGLGWMLRGHHNTARTDLALAVARRKAAAESTKLPAELWQYCHDLLSEEDQQTISEFFETERYIPYRAAHEPHN
jgi:tetratricopeptide (TPR) repeat protein